MAPIPKFTTPPPEAKYCILSFPAPAVLLVTLNRPKDLNCINTDGHIELDAIFNWLDREPNLIAAIITGKGRAFCAGADLKEVNQANNANRLRYMPPGGFGGLSRRNGLKPIIAAVNGLAFGGGTEIICNIDLALASPNAVFGLPEVKRGLTALAGALPRLVRTVGKPRAMEMALTGRNVSAREALEWGLINKVVEEGQDVVEEAVKMATAIAENSPDSVIVSKKGIDMGWEGLGAEDGTRLWQSVWYQRLMMGENTKEGVRAFVEKRKPKWRPAKL